MQSVFFLALKDLKIATRDKLGAFFYFGFPVIYAILGGYLMSGIVNLGVGMSQGDVAIAISTSGNSLNVIRGVEAAHDRGLVTVGWTGATGGKLTDLVDYCFCVPSSVTARIQECHITLGHVLCELIEERLFGDQD